MIGFVLTGESGTARPGSAVWQQPGTGAALVGTICAILVFFVGAEISVLRDRRRHPRSRYLQLASGRYYSIPAALRNNVRVMVFVSPLLVLGLWLRHRYG